MKTLLTSICLLIVATIAAQPSNDLCENAIQLLVATNPGAVSYTHGDIREATKSTGSPILCTSNNRVIDMWYSFVAPFTDSTSRIIIRTLVDPIADTMDAEVFGLALYKSCDSTTALLQCTNERFPSQNKIELNHSCIISGERYLIRVWSISNRPDWLGNFRIGAYIDTVMTLPLWTETFDGGIEVNGWRTWGTCEEPDSNHNAGWKYKENGIFDQGAYVPKNFIINSPTLCDGAIGVDSDYNNTTGSEETWGPQPCSQPSMHYLESPAIFIKDWDTPGITLTWHQSIRNFDSQHFIAYRCFDDASGWQDWKEIEVNEHLVRNANAEDARQRQFLHDAAGHDSLQIRFIYKDYFYFWLIDDISFEPTEAHNLVVDSAFISIPPWAMIPADQVGPWFAMAGIKNKGVADQYDVEAQHNVVDISTGNTVLEQTDLIDTLHGITLEQQPVLFETIDQEFEEGNYLGTYQLSQHAVDFDSTDNQHTYEFNVGGTTFAHEDGHTRYLDVSDLSVFVENPSWVYGNVFYPERDVAITGMTFAFYNNEPLNGDSLQLFLVEWTDQNLDEIIQAGERHIVGHATWYFSDAEDEYIQLSLPLYQPGDSSATVIIEAGKVYLAYMAYSAPNFEEGKIFYAASEERDYTTTIAAFDTAHARGLIERPRFMTVFGHSITNELFLIDYHVKPGEFTFHPGHHIVPLVRLETGILLSNEHARPTSPIAIYPNPANDAVTISLPPGTERRVDIEISDTTGRIVLRHSNSQAGADGNIDLNTHSLPPGMYRVSIIHGKEVWTSSFVIQR